MASTALSNVTQGSGGTEVRHGVTRGLRQHVVGNADQRVLLAEHCAVFTDECQTVYIGINDNAQIVVACLHLVHDAAQVLLQRFGVMGKVARHVSIEKLIPYAEAFQKFGEYDAAHTIDAVNTDRKAGLPYCIGIDQIQVQYGLDVTVVEAGVCNDFTQMVDLSIAEVLFLSNLKHFVAVGSCQELAFAVQQLQGIPLAGVMRRRDDDASIGTAHTDSQFGGGCGGIAYVDDVEAHAYECSAHYVTYHSPRNTAVAPYHNLARLAGYEGGIGRCELDDIQRVQGISRASADSTADAGD